VRSIEPVNIFKAEGAPSYLEEAVTPELRIIRGKNFGAPQQSSSKLEGSEESHLSGRVTQQNKVGDSMLG